METWPGRKQLVLANKKNNALGKNKARGSLVKLHSEEPLLPKTSFLIQYKILSLFWKQHSKFLQSKFSVVRKS
jgi:hypothetical protein